MMSTTNFDFVPLYLLKRMNRIAKGKLVSTLRLIVTALKNEI